MLAFRVVKFPEVPKIELNIPDPIVASVENRLVEDAIVANVFVEVEFVNVALVALIFVRFKFPADKVVIVALVKVAFVPIKLFVFVVLALLVEAFRV